MDKIIAKGVRENNLNNVDIEIPRGKITVFTGVSGSGKSTLAFDTIFAEGQRRYLESLSSYAKQFVEKFSKPDLDYISGLSPSVSVDQKTFMRNPRSTVATITEIYDFIRLAYSKLGTPKCFECGNEIVSGSVETIMDKLKKDKLLDKEIDIYYPISLGKKGEFKKEIEFAAKLFTIARLNGKTIEIKKIPHLDKQKKHNLEIYIDTISNPKKDIKRLSESLDLAFNYGNGVLIVESKSKRFIFNKKLTCNTCSISFPEISPRLFSFNSPYGCCQHCEGIGQFEFIDESLVVDETKSISENAILPFTSLAPYKKQVKDFAKKNSIDIKKIFSDLNKKDKNMILYGKSSSNLSDFILDYEVDTKKFTGVLNILSNWLNYTKSEETREVISKYLSIKKCKFCNGSRLRKESTNEAKNLKFKLEKNFKINCKILSKKVSKIDHNIQSYARDLRYDLFLKECNKHKINYLLLGHHKDDLIENFFIRLLRGSGLKGLVSFNKYISDYNSLKIVRPFLSISKKKLIAINKKTFGFFVDDPTNYNDKFLRSRIRKLLKNLDKEGLSFKKFNLTLRNLSKSDQVIEFFVEKNVFENSKYFDKQKKIILNRSFFNNPDEIILRSLMQLIQRISKKKNYPRGKKLISLINSLMLSNNKVKLTLSGCIVEKIVDSVIIYPENR